MQCCHMQEEVLSAVLTRPLQWSFVKIGGHKVGDSCLELEFGLEMRKTMK